MKFLAIIPARYASTRFPAKPLALLGGKPVIQHVYERVSNVLDAIVATDDERIFEAVTQFGGRVVMTSTEHRTGTDRCLEAYNNFGIEADVVINVQGDEPFIAEDQIRALMQCFDNPQIDIATLIKPFPSSASFDTIANPNTPKVITNPQGQAVYFSRSVIPYLRGKDKDDWTSLHTYYKHIGIYAYRVDILRRITQMSQTPLELAESLEQLRWLENGLTIQTAITHIETIGIDTPEDLQKAEKYLQQHQ
ncbi:MAG: 3-deoxy-manno-octulosonate cytidylyltransferase [Paludibacteraceae bacterium]|nr:3-deoxy-manno-octulosonate cytidylyltransferase [Paludibacteraceae bacterium]